VVAAAVVGLHRRREGNLKDINFQSSSTTDVDQLVQQKLARMQVCVIHQRAAGGMSKRCTLLNEVQPLDSLLHAAGRHCHTTHN
jgi:hypothetical protein